MTRFLDSKPDAAARLPWSFGEGEFSAGEQWNTKLVELFGNELKDQLGWQRDNENQRSQLTNDLLLFAGAVIAFMPKDRPLAPQDLPYPTVLFGLGVFGFIGSIRVYCGSRLRPPQ